MNTAPRPEEKPAERRFIAPGREWLTLTVSVAKVDETESRPAKAARILNVSRTGVLLQARIPLTSGDRVLIQLGEGEAVLANVRWVDQNLAGCEFENPLARSRLSAVMLEGVNNKAIAARPYRAASGHPSQGIGDCVIGDLIAQRRKVLGMTQGELGDAVNVSTATVCKWERGQAKPRKGAIQRLSAILAKDLSIAADPLPDPACQPDDFAGCVQEFKHTLAAMLGIAEHHISVHISA